MWFDVFLGVRYMISFVDSVFWTFELNAGGDSNEYASSLLLLSRVAVFLLPLNI